MFKKIPFHRIAFLLFLSALIIAGSIYIIKVKSESIRNGVVSSQKFHLKVIENLLEKEVNNIASDLLLISYDNNIQNYLSDNSNGSYEAFYNEFKTFFQN